MSGSYLLDTNSIINILKFDNLTKNFKNSKDSFFFSVITEIELLSYTYLTDEEDNKIREFLGKSCVINIDENIKEDTIKLRKKYNLKIPDALICGTALNKNLNLVTDDKILFKVLDIKILFLKDLFS
jgi:hypothetical protein